tara:strand:- start:1994 stop:2200 length:207 start_codon:yes stop_codon:yes gene_type:complete
MKLPKTKSGLYVVIRYVVAAGVKEGGIPVGVFAHLDEAEDYAGKCLQEFLDKGIDTFDFVPMYTMFYA